MPLNHESTYTSDRRGGVELHPSRANPPKV